MSPQDVMLIQRWNDTKDPDAFAEIVKQYAGLVYGSCLRVLRNPADAEEVSQECFMKIAEAPVEVNTSLGGWLHTLATRRAINRVRTDSRRTTREQTYADSQPLTDVSAWDDVQHLIDETIAELPDDLRVPIVEHYLMGRTLVDVGEELNLSRQGVSLRIKKAVEVVRAELRKKGVPVAPLVLSTGFMGLANATPSAVLQTGLLKSAIAGVDSTVLTSVSTATTSFFTPAVALLSGVLITGIFGLWVVTSSSKPEPPTSTSNVAAIDVDNTAAENSLTSSVSTSTETNVVATPAVAPLTPDFTLFSEERPFPGPSGGSMFIYVDDPNGAGTVVTIVHQTWKPWENTPTKRLRYQQTVKDDKIAFFKNLPYGNYLIDLTKGNKGSNSQFELDENLPGVHFSAPLLPRSSVKVGMVNEDGEPIQPKRAFIYRHQFLGPPLPYSKDGVYPTGFDDAGNVSISNVVLGRVKVYAIADGYAPKISEWISSRKSPAEVVLDHGGSFSGRVVDEFGDPLIEVIVHLRGVEYGDIAYGYTDEDGQVTVDNIRPADYSVKMYSEHFVLQDSPAVVSIVKGETAEFGDIKAIPGQQFSGRVYDENTEQGIPGVKLTVESNTGVRYDDLVTDTDGYYTFTNAAFTSYNLRRTSTFEYGYGSGNRSATISVTPKAIEGNSDFVLRTGIPVTGQIVDENGRPIAGAVLRSGPSLKELNSDTITDRNGRFKLNSFMEAGPLFIRAQATGFARIKVGPFEVPEEGLSGLELELPKGAYVSGKIRIDGRYARPQTYVWSQPTDPETEEAKMGTGITYTYCGAYQAMFLMQWLSEGTYDVSVEERGGSRSPTVATVSVKPGQLIEGFDLNYQTGGLGIGGIVRDRQNNPVTNAQLRLQDKNGTTVNSTTNGEGRFEFSGLKPDEYTLVASHSGHSSEVVRGVKAPYTGLQIIMPDFGTVKGYVRNAADGTAVNRFKISRSANVIAELQQAIPDGKTFSSTNGFFELSDVKIGDSTLVITSEGMAPTLVQVRELGEGPTSENFQVVMEPAAILEGRVFDIDGNPIRNAKIHSSTHSYSYARGNSSFGKTDHDGFFSISQLPEGERKLMVSHGDFASSEFDVDLQYGQDQSVEVILAGGGSLIGTVYEGGTPLQGLMVTLMSNSTGSKTIGIQTNERGEYKFEKIPAGDYYVNVYRENEAGNHSSSERFLVAIENFNTQILDWTY